jgi:hypothetical protein
MFLIITGLICIIAPIVALNILGARYRPISIKEFEEQQDDRAW